MKKEKTGFLEQKIFSNHSRAGQLIGKQKNKKTGSWLLYK